MKGGSVEDILFPTMGAIAWTFGIYKIVHLMREPVLPRW